MDGSKDGFKDGDIPDVDAAHSGRPSGIVALVAKGLGRSGSSMLAPCLLIPKPQV